MGERHSPMWTARPVRLDRVAKHASRSFDTGRKTVCRVPRRLRDALDTGGPMRRSSTVRAVALGLLALLLLPGAALADTFDAAGNGLPDSVGINSLWVIVAGCFVMFMQAGFAFLEIGFSRGKNAGNGGAQTLTNFSIAAILYWAVGFAFAFGGATGHIIGDTGFF